ncbi:MAG TPA: dual specificity protein phosphatase family protein [Sedimentisphaerales bacterium]|nr:dual specificity protein phosphatase family protein [Sedimentisphaerales bacterium]
MKQEIEDMGLSKGMSSKQRFVRVAVLIAVLSGGGIAIWKGLLEDRIIPKKWGVIEEGKIYRSGQLSATLVKRVLRKHNIGVIVDLGAESQNNKDQAAEIKAAAELGIRIERFPLSGNGTGDIERYAQAIAALVEARRVGKPVLVHCAAGAQRTGGVTACYRLLVERRDAEFAYRELRRYGWRPKKNAALLRYVNENMAQLASLLKEMGVIEEIPDPLPQLHSPGG